MLYDLLGITSTSTILMWVVAGIAIVVVVPVLGIVTLVVIWTVGKVALSRKASRVQTVTPVFRFDVFLSYSSHDRQPAASLAERMDQQGVKVFFADRHLEAGVPFTEEIRKALHDSRETWVLATQKSLDSTWVATEWGIAWGHGRKIIPVLFGLNPTDLPDRLRALQTVKYELIDKELISAKKRFSALPAKA